LEVEEQSLTEGERRGTEKGGREDEGKEEGGAVKTGYVSFSLASDTDVTLF